MVAAWFGRVNAGYEATDWMWHQPYLKVSVTAVLGGESTVIADDVFFTPDWSYENYYDPEQDGCNFPICDKLLPGQYVPVSGIGAVRGTIWYQGESGGEYNADYNSDYAIFGEVSTDIQLTGNSHGHLHWVDLANYPTATSVEIGGNTYQVGGGCGQYAIYYVNAYGYWDTLAVLGKTKETDNIVRHTSDLLYNNAIAYARARSNYVNEITKRFTFYTHWLTDAQSARMHHLLNSPKVLLHDVAAGIIRPLVLTGSSTEHKRNGLNQYTIEAELAQQRLRR